MKKIIFITLQVILLTSCSHTNKELSRKPASLTKLAFSSSQIMSALQNINRRSDLWFSLVQTVSVESESVVSVVLKNENNETSTLRFSITEEKCGLSSCPLKAEPLAD